MELFKPAKLTASKRFDLVDGEVEYCTVSASVLDRNKSVILEEGTIAITSHHLFHVDNSYRKPLKLSLGEIKAHEVHNSLFRRTPRIDLFTADSQDIPHIRVGLSRDRASEVNQHLEKSLARKAWVQAKPKEELQFSTRHAGIAGVMRRQQQGRDRNNVLTKEAFQDLDSLMTKAKEIVEIVEKYSATVRNQGRGTEGSNEEKSEFDNLLHNMGISNPVTKRAAGSLYHEHLSRQVADFLTCDLARHSKMKIISLTDLYAIVNRARGAELVSPDDLFQACALFEPLHLGFHIHTFPSGVIVVQPDSFTPESVSERVREAVRARGSMTASEAAEELCVSIPIATEVLTAAEQLGVLCRDEDPAQLSRYFENLFPYFVGKYQLEK